MLTLYEESQAIFNMRSVLAQMFGLPKENVRVITKFVGSGFGSKLWPWTHCPLAAAAARQLGKPVKLVLSRKMMFQSVGHRARTQQRVRLGATPEGKLVSLQHDYVYHRSVLDNYRENCGEATAFQYSVPNLRVKFGRATRNIGTPSDMRGPGAVPGLYATESAMNELADQLKIDPVQLRVLNEPKIDESLGIPFSSRHFLECLDLGAQKFGWSKRNPEVGSMKKDGLTLGWGMAGAAWVAARFPAAASVEFRDDGTIRVASGTQDIGSGSGEATFGEKKPKFSTHSFGCHFVEVTWQPEIARLRVSRVVTVIDAGRIINPLAGRNQIEGAVVMEIGMALLEHTTYDPQSGAPINSNLADYMVAVNADAPPIDVHFLDFPDKEINELGARGIGEIGLAGVAAAVTSAVHHATGVRVRELPVKIENLLV